MAALKPLRPQQLIKRLTAWIPPNIPKELREIRLERGIKQVDVSDYLQVDQSTVHNWENDKRDLSIDYFLGYCEYLGIEVVTPLQIKLRPIKGHKSDK